MKIGILTLHKADSYGAVLQAYALQRVLKGLGADSEFLSFSDAPAGAVPGWAENAAPAPLIRRLRQAGEQRAALFEDFRGRRLVCAPECAPERAEELDSVYDRFVVGSDQVWNLTIPGVDGRYFLPFVSSDKRFSYAASFGTADLPERVRGWCGAQLKAFRGLSVREESGRRLVRELTGRDAAVCLDPTLLLDREDWEKLARPLEGPPYALLFLLQNNSELADAAREAAGRKGLVLRTVTGSFLPRFGFDAWSGTGVEQWLSLIRHAECVFTNSFHGAVFSLLFGRPLRTARLTGRLADRNGRMEELLEKTGTDAAFRGLCAPLSPGLFAERLGAAREISMNYLKGITEDGAVF